MKPTMHPTCLLLFLLLATFIKAEIDFEEQVFQALMKKLAREGVKVDEDKISLLRATADKISKRLVDRGMEHLVKAELTAKER